MNRLVLCLVLAFAAVGCRATDMQATPPIKTEGEYLHASLLRVAEKVSARLGASDPLLKELLELVDYAYKHKNRCSDIAARWKLLESRLNDQLASDGR